MDAPEPLANIIRHPNIAKDLKDLRRYPKAAESLDAWERFFAPKV